MLVIASSPEAMLDMESPTVQAAGAAVEDSIAMWVIVSYLYDGARISLNAT